MIILIVIWMVPVLGLFVSSFRYPQQISSYGWWEVFGDFLNGRTKMARLAGAIRLRSD